MPRSCASIPVWIGGASCQALAANLISLDQLIIGSRVTTSYPRGFLAFFNGGSPVLFPDLTYETQGPGQTSEHA